MKKEADRIKRWREKQKAEGKTSFTILLSREARGILTEEKEKTGENYAVIVERALEHLKRTGYRPPKLHPLPRREQLAAHGATVPPGAGHQNGKKPLTVRTGILIDDLADEPTPGQTGGDVYGSHTLRENESLITRILRSSRNPFGRKKPRLK